MRASSAAETTNVAALIQYARPGPCAAIRMPPSTGPTIHVRFSTVWNRDVASGSSASSTRLGMPAYTAGRKKPVAIPTTAGERDDRRRAVREREHAEHGGAHEIGDDQQPPPREPVDERREQEPDHDHRQEVRDQERAHPGARAGAVEDVDGQRDGGEIRAHAGAEGGEKEAPEVGRGAEEVEAEDAPDANSLPGGAARLELGGRQTLGEQSFPNARRSAAARPVPGRWPGTARRRGHGRARSPGA